MQKLRGEGGVGSHACASTDAADGVPFTVFWLWPCVVSVRVLGGFPLSVLLTMINSAAILAAAGTRPDYNIQKESTFALGPVRFLSLSFCFSSLF